MADPPSLWFTTDPPLWFSSLGPWANKYLDAEKGLLPTAYWMVVAALIEHGYRYEAERRFPYHLRRPLDPPPAPPVYTTIGQALDDELRRIHQHAQERP